MQLVGVDHGPDGLHLAVGDVEGEDVDDAPFGVVGDRPRLAVDPRQFDTGAHLRSAAGQPEHEPGHLLPPVDRPGRRPGLAAAIAHHSHVRREQFEQGGHVTAAGRLEEPAGHLLTLRARGLVTGFLLVDVVPGPGKDLTAVRLGLTGDVGDLVVVVAEHLAQQEHRTFGRRQAFHQDEEGHGQRVGHLRAVGGIGFTAGQERFWEPGAHVGLPPHPRGPQVADGQAGGGSGQVGLGRVDAGAVTQHPGQPEEGLLDDVLGVTDAPGHPVGDREHQRPEF